MYCPYFPPQYSGAAKQAVSLARQLNLLKHHVEFVTIHDHGLPKHDMYEGFPVHRIEVNGRRNQEIPFWPNFFKFAWKNRHRFDILHSHGAHYINSVVGPIGKILGWKSLVKSTMSNDDLSGMKRSLSGMLHNFFLTTVDAYIAISSDLVEEFKDYGFNEKDIHFIPNGVDTKRFHPVNISGKKAIRQKLNLPVNKRIFLSVGVFDHRKNIGWLIEEWEKNNGFGVENFFLTIGPQSREDKGGKFLKSLREITSKRSYDMRLLDHVDNIDEYYRASDIFILPSINEGLPNVVLEAMASGLPCIATRASGTRDLILDGVTGFLFEQNNVAEFSKKLLYMSDSHIAEMGLKARMVAEEKFSINVIAHRYLKLYKKITNSDEQAIKNGFLKNKCVE